MDNVGFAIEHGIGVEQDREEAARWYRRAAEQGDTQAQDRLARLLVAGGNAADLAEAQRWTRHANTLREARLKVCNAPSIIDGMYRADLDVSHDPQMSMGQFFAALGGATAHYTVRAPYLVKVADITIQNGPFNADPVSQRGAFICQGFHTRGDDHVAPVLDRNDIDDLRERRDAADYGSSDWRELDSEIDNAEMAGGLTDFMNQQIKLHPVYIQYYEIIPIGAGKYRITPVNRPVTQSHPIEVDGPKLDDAP
jgi:TPR repeat protein